MEHIEKSLLEADGDVADFRAVSIPLRCDVRRLLDPTYKHLARRQDLLQTTIVLGPQNREFVPFAALGAYLRNAVQICEDGSFFHHHGFLIKHVNDSLRLNLRERRFARGASTITMQLVKNLFLSEEKTLSRKLQEGMLTWWIEREVPKERMFEIYLNIIEFGPHLYGAGPAARHYFQCTPSALSPVQAAWLATIISNPEKHTHPSYGAMVALVVRRMAERGLISDEDLAAMEEEFFQGTEGQHVSLPDDMGGAIDEESDEDDEAEPAFNKNTAPTPAATPAAPAPAAPPAH
jgi:membrane peptidoglycan carboxypeptidase